MQAVILAAGRGTRMGKLTEAMPKSLLQVAGRSLIEYGLDALPESIDEVIIVVGYLGSLIHDRFGPEYAGKRLLYVEMEQLHGTAAALWQAKDVLKDRFMVLPGDDIYSREDADAMAHASFWALGVAKIPALKEGGKIVMERNGSIKSINEGSHDGHPGFINCSLALLDTRIFACPMVPKSPGSEEFGLPQTALAAAHALNVPLRAIELSSWMQITYPEDLKKAEEHLAGNR